MAGGDGQTDTFTAGFADGGNDERAAARHISEKFRTTHHETQLRTIDRNSIEKIAAQFGEPYADTSAIPLYLLAQLAAEHVKVVLTGDGGDEIFAGYRRHVFHLAEERLRNAAPLAARQTIFGTAGALYPKLDWAPRALRFKTTFQALSRSSEAAYAAASAINLPMRVQAMMSGDLKRSIGGYRPETVVETPLETALRPIRWRARNTPTSSPGFREEC